MIGAGPVFMALVVVGLPVLLIAFAISRTFRLREKQLEVEALALTAKAKQEPSYSTDLESRVRVLEQIVTDGGAQTAAQIEALRSQPVLTHGEMRQ